MYGAVWWPRCKLKEVIKALNKIQIIVLEGRDRVHKDNLSCSVPNAPMFPLFGLVDYESDI